MQEIWNIVIMSSKDSHYDEEYKHLMDDVTALIEHKNIRFIIYEYDDKKKAAGTKIYEYAFNNQRIEISAQDCGDLYQKADLIYFFKNIVYKENTIDLLNKYMIITWGHGAGMGVFAKIERIPRKKGLHDGTEIELLGEIEFEKAREDVEKSLSRQLFWTANNLASEIDLQSLASPIINNLNISTHIDLTEENTNLFEHFKNDFNNVIPRKLKMLTGTVLNDIFSSSFPQNTMIDVLITINCYTQCFEFGNCLRSKVSLLVAPQTMIPFEGINYRQLFSFINDNREKNIEADKIARNLTTSFWPKYERNDLREFFSTNYASFPLGETSFSCNLLGVYNDIELIIGEVGFILNKLCSSDQVLRSTIITARDRCEDTTAGKDYGLIDFTIFFQSLIIDLNNNKKNLPLDLNESLDKLNTLYLNFIENARKNCCLSLCMSHADAYIQFDGNITEKRPVKISSRSPFFLSIFFPNEMKAAMPILLAPAVAAATGAGTTNTFNYDNWKTFVTNLFP